MKVVIVAKTRMGGGACIGAISTDGQSVRLIAHDMATNEHFNLEYQIGDVWEVETDPPTDLKPPHVENIIVRSKRLLQAVSRDRVMRFIEQVMPPACGGPDLLYDGLIQASPGGAMYIAERTGIPAASTLFWRPDRDLTRDEGGKRIRYRYPTPDGGRTLTFVGFQDAISVIPAGTLVRVSLAHWWRPETSHDLELRCYLQLSGWLNSDATPSLDREPFQHQSPVQCAPQVATPTEGPILDRAQDLLKSVFGYNDFLPLQNSVIANVLAHRDTLAILPTGGGKSLCYQLPALLFDGVTLVISPLISLMQDQVNSLLALGVPATYLNSTLDYKAYVRTQNAIRQGKVKLVYMAPETLLRPETLTMLDRSHVACIAIDEAHCISSWGHDFRPEYRQLLTVRHRYPDAVCIALTATATRRVQDDIAKVLGFDPSDRFIASFNRPNLYLEAHRRAKGINQILTFLELHKGESGIIYCQTRLGVETLTEQLTQVGWNALPYHAGMDDVTRALHQQRFSHDEVPMIVATIAFGMGIDKSNVRFIIHATLPSNLESYYQEIGRAGRDGLRADCLLLWHMQDIFTVRRLINAGAQGERAAKERRLQEMLAYAQETGCRRRCILDYFGEAHTTPRCTMCDNCVANTGLDSSLYSDLPLQQLGCEEPGADKRRHTSRRRAENKPRIEEHSCSERLLFEELRRVRLALAKAAKVPPFVIFSDRTLWEMVHRLPQTPEALLAVHGVGRHKLASYGQQFLDAIRSHCEQNEGHGSPTGTEE